MCTYGIGLPFDHPIWRNLPPCRCGGNAVQPSITQPFTVPSMPVGPALANGPYKCPDCGTWFSSEHRCQHVLSTDCWCEPRVEQVPPA